MAKSSITSEDAHALRLVVEGTAAETGTAFFRALVKNLATVMDTYGAWVTEYLPETKRLRALAFWLRGDYIADYEYPYAGTACEPVVEAKRLVHIPDRLLELYPHDTDLVSLNAVSYLGVPLLDTGGEVMGHLSVLDDKPLPADPRLISLFEIFAARAAAEQRRLRQEQAVRAREEELSALLNNAMDAVVVFNAKLVITRANPAAERLFACTTEDLIGEKVSDFLVKDSIARVEMFAKELESRPEGKQQLWVPQDFVARRWDHSVFPAEATLSRFESQRQFFYTLILRNVDERVEAEKQIQLLLQETEYLREAVRELPGHDDLLGRSDCMQAVFGAIKQVSKTDTTVLITGETGTGKELVARSIHRASNRKNKSVVLVNCAAIPANLIESEFFGHERGAFTGAVSRREGRFSLANGGTIFLDEIGELPLELQAKLLRVLQEGEFEPLGSAKTVKVDVRVVAATNRDLGTMVAEGKFREDLFYRLNVFPLRVPSLRERGPDIGLLAQAFLERFARRMGRRIAPLPPDDVRRLQEYHWPGNVRELQNVIERALILATGSRIDLYRALPAGTVAPSLPVETADASAPRILNAAELEAIERLNLERALAAANGKISGTAGAAEILGLPPSTVTSRMKALGIQRKN